MTEHAVVIAGGGPTGLMLAGELALAGLGWGCGGSDAAGGPAVVTGEMLGDELAVALKRDLEQRGLFGTVVGERGGMCRGGPVRWSCTVDVRLSDGLLDRRAFDLRMGDDGCWRARQTGTDVGVTGRPARPGRPGVLRGCVE